MLKNSHCSNEPVFKRQKTDHPSDMKECLKSAVKNGDSNGMIELANYYKGQNNTQKMLKYLQMAKDNNNSDAMVELASYYAQEKDFDKMKEYILLAIENGNVKAMNYYGIWLLVNSDDVQNMKKYFLMACELGHSGAMHNLAQHYKLVQDYTNMGIFFEKAIEKDNANSMLEYGKYFCSIEDYENAKKYLLMACEKNKPSAMHQLALVFKKEQDYVNMEKYLLMGYENGLENAYDILISIYTETRDDENIIKVFTDGYDKMQNKNLILNHIAGLANGNLLKKNYSVAVKYILLAHSKGHRYSKDTINNALKGHFDIELASEYKNILNAENKKIFVQTFVENYGKINDFCIICHDNREDIIKLNCNHCICKECFTGWYSTNILKCVYCRKDL